MLDIKYIRDNLKWVAFTGCNIRWIGTEEKLRTMITFENYDTVRKYPSDIQQKDLQEFAKALKKYLTYNPNETLETFYAMYYNTEVPARAEYTNEQNVKTSDDLINTFIKAMFEKNCNKTGRYKDALDLLGYTYEDITNNFRLKNAYRSAKEYIEYGKTHPVTAR